MSNEGELLKLLLPEYLIAHLDIVKFEEIDTLLHIYFETDPFSCCLVYW